MAGGKAISTKRPRLLNETWRHTVNAHLPVLIEMSVFGMVIGERFEKSRKKAVVLT